MKIIQFFLLMNAMIFGWLPSVFANPDSTNNASIDLMDESATEHMSYPLGSQWRISYLAASDTISGDSDNLVPKDSVPEYTASQGIKQELADGFKWRINTLGFAILQDPETSSFINADNRLNINRYQAEIDLRPDLELNFRRLELSVKPRWEFTWKKWEDGGTSDGDDEFDERFFVNEWLARFMAFEQLFLSYGRENLQWGPSYMISSSNPFTKDNGKNNPKKEVPGLDYGRAVWIPNYTWTVSMIANTDEGEAEFFSEFERTYAIKIDYTGNEKYFSLIPSYRESDDEYRVGYFGRWSATDAFLFWCEGNVLLDSDSEIENMESGDVDILIGSSYTLEMGPTISLEYYHNEGGCTDSAQECIAPTGSVNLDDILIRENYILTQYVDTNIWDALDIVVRLIWDLDDGSSRTIGIFEYEINDNVNLFAVGDYYAGEDDDEFGSLLNYSIFAGVELTY